MDRNGGSRIAPAVSVVSAGAGETEPVPLQPVITRRPPRESLHGTASAFPAFRYLLRLRASPREHFWLRWVLRGWPSTGLVARAWSHESAARRQGAGPSNSPRLARFIGHYLGQRAGRPVQPCCAHARDALRKACSVIASHSRNVWLLQVALNAADPRRRSLPLHMAACRLRSFCGQGNRGRQDSGMGADLLISGSCGSYGAGVT